MPISKLKREFRDEMRKNLLSSKLKQVKFSDIQCSRREVEEFLIQYKDSLPKVPEELELYHILRVPKISEGVKSKLKARAQIILDSIKAGGDFSDFARRYSEDMGSATVGGDLGFARRGQFVKEFEEAVFALEENEFSEIIETVFGFHIIQLLERRGESVHARHILFKFERDSSAIEDVKTFLKSLKDSVTIGIPFAELAKRYSEDKESGPLGGYLGRIPLNQLEPNLIAVVNNMNEGEISDPIEVSFGSSTAYQIVYIKKRIPEHEFNLVDDWKQLEQLATNNKRNIEYQKWLKKLREEIYWEVRL